MNEDVVRKYLFEILDWDKAHVGLANLLSEVPMGKINFKIDKVPHSLYDLLEHMRICQRDIIDFIQNPDYIEKNWPEDYWPPEQDAQKIDWEKSLSGFLGDIETLKQMALDPAIDLTAPIPHAPGYTVFRELVLAADHNTYHLGQMVILKKALV